jgi:hydrogenase expression/formation protein HypD
VKYLSEYRDKTMVEQYVREIHNVCTQPWTLMEICGGQTHSLVRNGIIDMLPSMVTMVHGPGCPVCVTPTSIIDEAIYLASEPNVILCSFGDMLRVPGSSKSLLESKALGADVRIIYSPLEAVKLASENPGKEIVFLAVGFETTAPANALSVVQAHKLNINNYSILASHVLVPPAMEAILSDPQSLIDGFLAAGHVCTIMGLSEYEPIVEKYKVPIVVTGFEPLDLLQGILMTIRQLERGEAKLENQYARFVHQQGNVLAQKMIGEVFEVGDRVWRGIGEIPHSGYEVRSNYQNYSARHKFALKDFTVTENNECISGDIMKGLKKPMQCPNFGTKCRPEHPIGAPMVSTEGSCAAYFAYQFNQQPTVQ